MNGKFQAASLSLVIALLFIFSGVSSVRATSTDSNQNNNGGNNNGIGVSCNSGTNSGNGSINSGDCSTDNSTVGSSVNQNSVNVSCDCKPSPTPTPTPPPTGGNLPGGGGGGNGGGGTGGGSSCPNGPQTVDQVWLTDITSTTVTVHWANKGDATGYQLAYGPKNNKWQWGVKVGNVNQYTIKDIPAGLKVFVTVIPLNGDCPGGASSTPQVLAATGTAKGTALFLSGLALIALGVWKAQKSLASAKAK